MTWWCIGNILCCGHKEPGSNPGQVKFVFFFFNFFFLEGGNWSYNIKDGLVDGISLFKD